MDTRNPLISSSFPMTPTVHLVPANKGETDARIITRMPALTTRTHMIGIPMVFLFNIRISFFAEEWTVALKKPRELFLFPGPIDGQVGRIVYTPAYPDG